MEKNKGGQPSEKNSSHDARGSLKLKDLGINYSQSQRWQQIAESHGEAKAWGISTLPRWEACTKPWLMV
jgi:hypothetical protein